MKIKITFFILVLLLGSVVSADGKDGVDTVQENSGQSEKSEQSKKLENSDVVLELPEIFDENEVFEPEMIFPDKGIIIIDRMLNLKFNIFPNHDNFFKRPAL